MHHRCRRGHRQDVTGDFDGALFRLRSTFLRALGMGHRTDVPDVGQNFPGVIFEQSGQVAVGPRRARRRARKSPAAPNQVVHVGNVGDRAIQAHVALALLFGIVERVRVEERPDELPADIFQAKFKMRVLVDRVVAGLKRGRADLLRCLSVISSGPN